jgi:hypothetical protein
MAGITLHVLGNVFMSGILAVNCALTLVGFQYQRVNNVRNSQLELLTGRLMPEVT